MQTQGNPHAGNMGAKGTNGFFDKLKVSFSPKEINVYQYVQHLESVVARWMVLAVVQTAALLYLVTGGAK